MFTADVSNLYPSIDIDDGLSLLSDAINLYNSSCSIELHVNLNLTVNICRWVLKNNYIKFGNTVWLQLRGTAMGTPLAVVFANIYLAMLEKRMFKLYYRNYPTTPRFTPILLYLRYIDDILCVTESPEHAIYLINLLNNMHKNLKFTHVGSHNSVDFLDITVYKGSQFQHNNLFDIAPYQKPMNKYLYIPLFSHHCKSVFKGFIQSEIQRYTRNSTNRPCITAMCKLLRERLLARGYPADYLDSVMNISYTRTLLLFPPSTIYPNELLITKTAMQRPSLYLHMYNPSKTTTSTIPTIFIIPYTPSYTTQILRDILTYNNPTKHNMIFENHLSCISNHRCAPIICFTRTKSIGDELIHSNYNYNVCELQNK